MTWAELPERDPEGFQARLADPFDWRPRGGESYRDLMLRAVAWYESLESDAVVVSHGGVSRVLRGHLLFAEWTHERMNLLPELQRTSAPLAAVDLICSIVLVLEGLWVAASRPVGGVLIVGLGLGIALARLVLERSTTRAAFGA